jgi:four helix bundle protein
VRAASLDDLCVYQNAKAAEKSLAPILDRPCFRRDFKLRDQINDAMVKIAPNIAEGFGQGTDRHCAHFQYVARGACNEVQAHLASALARQYISALEHGSLCERYTIVGKQLTRWIQHLNREDRKRRG